MPAAPASPLSGPPPSGGLRGIVLAGGRSSRLGGRHKPGIAIAGAPIVARALEALRRAGADAIVVGEADGVPADVPVVREDPPHSGPLAALAAGVRAAEPRAGRIVLVVGGDMPFLTAAGLRRLASAAGGGAALAQDEDGRLQPLCAAWDEDVLRARIDGLGELRDRPLRALHEALDVARVALPTGELADVDTPEDLDAAVRAAQERG